MKVLSVKRTRKVKNATALHDAGGVPVFLNGFGVPASLRALAPDGVQWIDSFSGQPLSPERPQVRHSGRNPSCKAGELSDGCPVPGMANTNGTKKTKRPNTCMDD
ncbi:MAG: hypothetical protein L6Q97_19525 [Thermoanaerobaculia bacterium]|nr:hypothetical protein [Thermoanaerobaculia bacterium]